MLLYLRLYNEESQMPCNVKPVVKVYLLPDDWDQIMLRKCFDALLAAAKQTLRSPVEDTTDLVIIFPKDAIQKGLGREIIIEVDVPISIATSVAHEDAIAEAFHAVMTELLPKAYVQCKVYKFDTEHGFCSS